MKKYTILLIYVGVLLTGVVGCGLMKKNEQLMIPIIASAQEVKNLFPSSKSALIQQNEQVLAQANKSIDAIIAIAPEKRTYANTVAATDAAGASISIMMHVAWALQNLSPEQELRDAACEAILKMQGWAVDTLSNNPELYRALKEYAAGQGAHEKLNAEEKKYLQELLDGFAKSGLNLPLAQQEEVKKIKKELARLGLEFNTNVAKDQRSIKVTREALAGLDDAFVNSLQRDDSGCYVLGVDYPTYFSVMETCSVGSTRCALRNEFMNRAYPANEPVLHQLIALRDKLAKLLGFASYAALDLDDEMAKTPERAQEFLRDLQVRTNLKLAEEMADLKKELPAGVELSKDGRFQWWDLSYITTEYKKKHFSLDENKLREYFPMQKTVDELLDIYAQFLGVEFRQENLKGLWHEDARYVAVHKKDGTLLGHLILDLHPRPYKYGHACMSPMVPAVREKDGTYHPPVIVVIANFAKPTADRPSLLKHDEVKTFFHEFGHAMHGLFGATQMAGFSGTNVKTDFVEMPSQMLEEWMFDPMILKKVSGHYLTGAPLSDELIEKIREAKTFGNGFFIQRQIVLGTIAFACFSSGENKDPNALTQSMFDATFSPYIMPVPGDHFAMAFGHLNGYGSRYYAYLWSKVYAVDMFEHIKKFGLLNYEIGKEYIAKVIGKGGSVDPDILIADFLGRTPTLDAFLKDLGV